jgi:putative oxygen-independent coproporphyrinogen III oxidase
LRRTLPDKAYVEALKQDFLGQVPSIGHRKIATIFMGGGTPSLFSASCIADILDFLKANQYLADDCEITLEANPGSFEQKRFQAYQQAGVNRISLGVQTFSAKHLKALGRVHSVDEAKVAIETATKMGFSSVNVDIMYGLPGQVFSEAMQDLETVNAYSLAHVSWYQLTLEPNTSFAKRPPAELPNHDQLADMAEAGVQFLAQEGFERYEISAYAKEKMRCQHNMNYWQYADYLGIGAGAHGKVTSAAGEIYRSQRCKSPKFYLRQANMQVTQKLVPYEEQLFELLLNHFRLMQKPLSRSIVESRSQWTWAQACNKFAEAEAKGWLHMEPDQVMLTDLGARFYNDVLELFLAAQPTA